MSTENPMYPDFVTYHFLNPKGELKAMEEDGEKTEKILKQGLSVDGSSVGVSNVNESDLKIMPEGETLKTIKIGDFEYHR